MDDGGISLTGLTIGGAALTTIGGLIGAWIKARYARTTQIPQPLDVRQSPEVYNPTLCSERHRKLDDQISCLFAGINASKTLGGKVESLETQVHSMDGKLDVIIKQLAKRR